MAILAGFKLRGLMVVCFLLLFAASASAQSQVMGKIQFVGASKVEKTSGVWIDGGYVGFLGELKEDNTVSLLPGEHEIAVRQAGYQDFQQKVVVEPGKQLVLRVAMQKDPRAEYPKVTAKVKLEVTPDRSAVFLDGAFVGHVQEFSGLGHAMLVSPGKQDRKSTRLNSSHSQISYAVFCLKKKKKQRIQSIHAMSTRSMHTTHKDM